MQVFFLCGAMFHSRCWGERVLSELSDLSK